MKVAVYSGSFNPLHKGHQAIMEYLTKSSGFDWVYLVVSPQNPFKGEENNLTANDRYEAAVEAVSRHPELKVWVDDIELGMEPPHYTIRTLEALTELEPENDYTLIVGGDNLASIEKWKEAERLLTEYGIAVYPRKGYDSESLRDEILSRHPEYKIQLIDAPIVNISSTEIREGIAQGRDMSDWMM